MVGLHQPPLGLGGLPGLFAVPIPPRAKLKKPIFPESFLSTWGLLTPILPTNQVSRPFCILKLTFFLCLPCT